jgi:cell division septum initiation protein DivIVA
MQRRVSGEQHGLCHSTTTCMGVPMSTTENVHGSFTTTRLREGYEISEVDQYLADTADTLRHRDAEIAELRRQLAEAVLAAREVAREAAPEPTTVDSSTAAARLLELAANNADQLVAEATAEAASLVATAQSDADQLAAASQAEADQVTAAARAEADQATAAAKTEAEQVTTEALAEAERVTTEANAEATRVRDEADAHRTQQVAELEEHRATVLGEVTEQRTTLEAEVAHLREIERGYQERMRSYLTQQLDLLDASVRDAAVVD